MPKLVHLLDSHQHWAGELDLRQLPRGLPRYFIGHRRTVELHRHAYPHAYPYSDPRASLPIDDVDDDPNAPAAFTSRRLAQQCLLLSRTTAVWSVRALWGMLLRHIVWLLSPF